MPCLVNLKKRVQHDADGSGPGHVDEMAFAHHGAEDLHRRGIESDRKRLGVPSPQPAGHAVQDVEHAQGGGEQRQPIGIGDGAHDHPLDEDGEQHGGQYHQREAGIVAEPVILDQQESQKGGDHGQIALGDVDDAGIAKNHHDGDRGERVQASGRQAAHDLLTQQVNSSSRIYNRCRRCFSIFLELLPAVRVVPGGHMVFLYVNSRRTGIAT